MNKKLVISLFAGALLLPASAAFAGVVSGICSDCHTMHNSLNGSGISATPNDTLLVGTGCASCHAVAGLDNDATTGKALTGHKAPQVDDSTQTLSAGYFVTGTSPTDANQHNVADISNNFDAAIAASTAGVIPGSSTTYADNTDRVTCQGCHTQAGHHTSSNTVYRMLSGSNTTTAAPNYGVAANKRADAQYDATAMNLVCAGCHGKFHTAANQEGSVSGSNWKRHPTDVRVLNNATTAPSIVSGYDWGADITEVPVGTDGTNNDIIMCISCHLPHGGPNADLLSYDYNVVLAGGTTATKGCETCHSYNSQGM